MADNLTDVSEIIQVLPPVPESSNKTLLVIGCLFLSFVMSIAGNISQFAYQHHTQRVQKQANSYTCSPLLFNIRLICFVQLFISMTLPAVIVDYLLEFWIFGEVACSLHFSLLNLGRTATSWLLLQCILDQVLQEKSLRVSDKRRQFINSVMHCAILFFGILLLVPTLRHIQLVEEVRTEENMQLRIERCIMGFHNNLNNRLFINSAVFIVDFALPLIVCSSLAFYLRHFRQQNLIVNAQDNRIQNLLVFICAIFFLCSLPHFFAIALILFAESLNFYLYSTAATSIADTALIFTYIPPATLWILLGEISKIVFEGMFFGSQHCLTLNSTTRTRVFSNNSFTSECHSLPDNLSRTCTKTDLKVSTSINILDMNPPIKSTKTSNATKRPNFKEIKLTNRSNKERLLRLEPVNVDEQL